MFPMPDRIHPRLLRLAREEIAGVFAPSSGTNEVPEEWRIANAVLCLRKALKTNQKIIN